MRGIRIQEHERSLRKKSYLDFNPPKMLQDPTTLPIQASSKLSGCGSMKNPTTGRLNGCARQRSDALSLASLGTNWRKWFSSIDGIASGLSGKGRAAANTHTHTRPLVDVCRCSNVHLVRKILERPKFGHLCKELLI